MKAWKKDLILSILLLLFCAAAYFYCATLPPGYQKYTMAHAGAYVQFWIVILAILSLALLIRTILRKPQEESASMWSKMVFLTLLSLAAYLFLMPHIGFTLATCLFLFGLAVAYQRQDTENRPSGKALALAAVKWFILCAVTTAALQLLFTKVLKVVLPTLGILGI
ncbi:tripartite tricarboxylate transporter TctB family protein [Oscillibacter sp. MSJ-2]|uniref:Tripartite tricarboxylate transporter TctB family protein n=1 Tax=Dysosmobacter acutus TaxID=2841504 RepID=A0ABS6F847_9FIRM|nr:tripartite tricarboxylate transporter TctB family protein [Dysosmobacter acutus]MBU5626463.1 tripartite tricarboxylate transporter TctB family protein [Dysosmobacter acutus]